MISIVPAWLWWLAAPALVTVAAALLSWWSGRPARQPTVAQSMRAHREFLAALGDHSGQLSARSAGPDSS
jgi:hypothetical protein